MTTLIDPLLPVEKPDTYAGYSIETFDAIVYLHKESMLNKNSCANMDVYIDLSERAVKAVFSYIKALVDRKKLESYIAPKQFTKEKQRKLEWILKNHKDFDFIAVDVNVISIEYSGIDAHVKLKFYFNSDEITPWDEEE